MYSVYKLNKQGDNTQPWHIPFLTLNQSVFLSLVLTDLYIWKFSVHVLLKPSLKDFEYYLASMWNESNCIVVWTFFVVALLWEGRWFLGKMTGAPEEYMGDVVVCDKFCLSAVWTCSVLSHDKSIFPGGGNSLGSDPWQLSFFWRWQGEITPFRVPLGRWGEFRESLYLSLHIKGSSYDKASPTMRETRVRPLVQEERLEKEMATHSSTLSWKSHGQRSLVDYSPWGHKESDRTEWLHFHFLCRFLSAYSWHLLPHFTTFPSLPLHLISLLSILHTCF